MIENLYSHLRCEFYTEAMVVWLVWLAKLTENLSLKLKNDIKLKSVYINLFTHNIKQAKV